MPLLFSYAMGYATRRLLLLSTPIGRALLG